MEPFYHIKVKKQAATFAYTSPTDGCYNSGMDFQDQTERQGEFRVQCQLAA
jgi:hypothetical protein